MEPRMVGALTMCPTGNIQGGYYFFSLNTGHRINQNCWTVLPIPDEMIKRVHQLARQDPLGIAVEDRSGSESLHDPPPEQLDEVEDDMDDSTYQPNENEKSNDD
eukprot:2395352-Ditylum_brightwellii.AAC.1